MIDRAAVRFRHTCPPPTTTTTTTLLPPHLLQWSYVQSVQRTSCQSLASTTSCLEGRTLEYTRRGECTPP